MLWVGRSLNPTQLQPQLLPLSRAAPALPRHCWDPGTAPAALGIPPQPVPTVPEGVQCFHPLWIPVCLGIPAFLTRESPGMDQHLKGKGREGSHPRVFPQGSPRAVQGISSLRDLPGLCRESAALVFPQEQGRDGPGQVGCSWSLRGHRLRLHSSCCCPDPKMGRISISCLLPASWHFSLSPVGCPRILNASLRQLLLLGAAAAAAALLLCSLLLLRGRHRDSGRVPRYLARVTDTEATDTGNPNLSYGIVVDCGSSGSRVFVYCWPRHNGNPKDLLDIQQMRDSSRKPVVMKIKPGISEFASSPDKVSDYISPLLSFAAEHVPRSKHKETPLYILCTAGMRILPESQQKAILEDLLTDIPVHFDFLFSDSHAEVISGKQEGVYAWIGINFVLGRFEHTDDEDEAVVEVQVPGSEHHDPIFRKRTVGILDMGGVSTQIAYEVPQSEEVAKSLLAEVNLGCDAHQTEHVYRVYVATFLGFGGNAARRRYEESLLSSSLLRNRQAGLSPQAPLPDPCLPRDAQDELRLRGLTLHLRGTGDFQLCRERLRPLLNRTEGTQSSLNGVFQPPVHLQSSEFYGFSEFYYCTEDVLRMGGDYSAAKFTRAAQDYCATRWSVLQERFERGLYAPHADLHRLKFQCFKSAWMFEVFHRGFSFPESYGSLKTALQVYDKEVQWTLGAILYRTRFLPLRDIQQENFRGIHSHWRSFSFVYNHYLFLACFLVVLLSILLYLLRLRRIHRRLLPGAASPPLWIQEGLPPQKLPG